MIDKCEPGDFKIIHEIINDSSTAYKGVIPGDCWHEPYMAEQELKTQIEQGVEFWGFKENEKILGIMGIQDKTDVMLIRHAYIRTASRNKGIGGQLLAFLVELTNKPILIGTWADADWAIAFYQRHDFRLLPNDEKDKLLGKYWIISQRQAETSVVLANSDWKNRR
jgi:N-acetylglutamate synthase-like GNAT family acetyltransferase